MSRLTSIHHGWSTNPPPNVHPPKYGLTKGLLTIGFPQEGLIKPLNPYFSWEFLLHNRKNALDLLTPMEFPEKKRRLRGSELHHSTLREIHATKTPFGRK